jgi:hypothetical protein
LRHENPGCNRPARGPDPGLTDAPLQVMHIPGAMILGIVTVVPLPGLTARPNKIAAPGFQFCPQRRI